MTVAAFLLGTVSPLAAFLEPFRKAAEQGTQKPQLPSLQPLEGTNSLLRAFLELFRKACAVIAALWWMAASLKNPMGVAATVAAFLTCFKKHGANMLDPKWSAMTVAASFSGTASSRLAFLKRFRKAAEQGAKKRYPKEAAAVIAAP